MVPGTSKTLRSEPLTCIMCIPFLLEPILRVNWPRGLPSIYMLCLVRNSSIGALIPLYVLGCRMVCDSCSVRCIYVNAVVNACRRGLLTCRRRN